MNPRAVAGLLVLSLVVAPGCASYRGSARDVTPAAVAKQAGWARVSGVPLVRQKGVKDCGAAALSMVLEYWQTRAGDAAVGGPLKVDRASIDRALRETPSEGLAAGELRDYARRAGYPSFVFQGSVTDLEHEIARGRPVIVGVHKPLSSGEALAHYEVLIGLNRQSRQVLTLDPAHGMRQNGLEAFITEWQSTGRVTLVVLPPDGAEEAPTVHLRLR